MEIRLGYELIERQKIYIPLVVQLEITPHAIIIGGSGSGKSCFVLYALNSILNYPITLYICDFKGSKDFDLELGTRYAEFDGCLDLLENFYDHYQNIKQNKTGEQILLVFDELPGFLLYLERTRKTKEVAEIKNKIAEVLMTGRCLPGGGSAWVWFVCQRADSTYFSNGSRDNFSLVVSLGRLSKESKGMLFPGEEIPEDYVPCTGRGLILEDGKPLRVFQVPQIDKVRLKKLLLSKAKQRAGGSR